MSTTQPTHFIVKLQNQSYSFSILINGESLTTDEINNQKDLIDPLIRAIFYNIHLAAESKSFTITAENLGSSTPSVTITSDTGTKNITDDNLTYLTADKGVGEDGEKTSLKVLEVFQSIYAYQVARISPVMIEDDGEDDEEKKKQAQLKKEQKQITKLSDNAIAANKQEEQKFTLTFNPPIMSPITEPKTKKEKKKKDALSPEDKNDSKGDQGLTFQTPGPEEKKEKHN